MIRLHCSFFSDSLGRDAHVTVLLPTKGTAPYPVLYLLHGLSDSAESWLNKTALERWGNAHHMAIVLPNAARSFYCDMAYGDAYYTHISQEIPRLCESLFPITKDPAKRYIAGNSMGGYGALKIALKNPGQFAKVGLVSAVLDVQQFVTEASILDRDWQLCFGGNQVPEGEDVLKLISSATSLPRLYHYCGTEDFLAEGNRTFLALCQKMGIPLDSTWEPGGVHEWLYWDKQLPALLDFMDEA